ncbi:MAG: hypothetical protein ACE5OW_08160 [Candidatus Bathyarchaeia archaeon]
MWVRLQTPEDSEGPFGNRRISELTSPQRGEKLQGKGIYNTEEKLNRLTDEPSG